MSTQFPRGTWTGLTDDQLLSQCDVDTYRASGPGGQKRNKTSSAVRLRHPPTGLLVIAEESRSQHENRERAVKRMRQSFYLKLRDPIENVEAVEPSSWPEIAQAKSNAGRLNVGKKDARYWPAVGRVLDVFAAVEARVSDAARLLDISTGNLVDFLACDPKVFAEANALRTKFQHKPLRADH